MASAKQQVGKLQNTIAKSDTHQHEHDNTGIHNNYNDDNDSSAPDAEPYSCSELHYSDPPANQLAVAGSELDAYDQNENRENIGNNENVIMTGKTDHLDGMLSTSVGKNIDNDVEYDLEMTVDIHFDGDALEITEGSFVTFKYFEVSDTAGMPLSPTISLNVN